MTGPDTPAEAIADLLTVYRERDRWQRRVLVLTGVLLVVAFLAMGVLVNRAADAASNVERVGRDTNRIVRVLDEQTSPERQATQRAAIERLLARVDCDHRRALQDTIDVLVERGVLGPGALSVTCPEGP